MMGCCGVWLFFIDLLFLVNIYFVHSQAWSPACSPTGALLHHCFPSNLSTTTQGAIVKLRGAPSELCTLLYGSVWNSKTANWWSANCSGVCWEELGGIGVSGSGYKQVLALEVLNVVDCVQRKRHAELPASASASCAHCFWQAL